MDNPRLREREKLTSLLSPLGLAIRDITPDGHCLYAAIADQLNLRLGTKVCHKFRSCTEILVLSKVQLKHIIFFKIGVSEADQLTLIFGYSDLTFLCKYI